MEIKIKLSNTEHKDLLSYCNLNDLLVSSVVKDSFTTGFNIERYGLLNAGVETKEKEVIKEIIKYVEVPKEVIKEVIKIEYVEIEKPVEKIVEVVREVSVDKVIEKSVEVIKEVENKSDADLKLKIDALQNTVQKLRSDNIEKDKQIKELQKTVEDIQKFNENKRAVYHDGSNLNKLL